MKEAYRDEAGATLAWVVLGIKLLWIMDEGGGEGSFKDRAALKTRMQGRKIGDADAEE